MAFCYCGNLVSLQDRCLLTVRSDLSPSNVWSIHRLVPYVHCPRIEHIVHSFICDNFMDISHSDQFLALDENEMQWLLDNQDIKVSEAAVLDSLARWYKHKERQRENAFKQLFDKLHLSVIGKDVLTEVIKKYQLVKVIPELRKYKKLFPKLRNLDDLIFQENISNIAVLGKCAVKNTLQYWMPLASKLLVITKCNALSCLDSLEGKDVFSFEKEVPFGNEVFILGIAFRSGGVDWTSSFNIRFNLITQAFKVCTPFFDSNALNDYISVPCGHFIFFIRGVRWMKWTGCTEDTVMASNVYRYDTAKDHWQEVQPAIMTHSSLTDSAVSFKNRYVYIFGEDFSEVYDLLLNTWTPLTTPWQDFYCLHAVTLGDQICVWLKTRTRNVRSVFDYHPATKIWHSHGELCDHRTTETFFGRIFSLHYRPAVESINGRRPMLYLSLMNNSNLLEQKRLISLKKHFNFRMDYKFHMTVLSRGTRLVIEQDETVQHVEK